MKEAYVRDAPGLVWPRYLIVWQGEAPDEPNVRSRENKRWEAWVPREKAGLGTRREGRPRHPKRR